MSEQPSPEPQKSKAGAAPKAASAPQGLDPSRAQAYVPLPGQAKPRGRGVLVLAALIAAGALAGTALHFRQAPPPPVVAAAEERKVLTVTDADLDVAATERVRRSAGALGAAGAVAGAAGAGSAGVSPVAEQASIPSAGVAPAPAPSAPSAEPATPAVTPETRAASPLPTVPPELISPAPTAPQTVLTAQGQQAVSSDGWSIFSMRLIDDVDQDGDVVQIFIDGVPVSYLALTHGGATLEIPLKKGQSHEIRVMAVRDGVGGVTLGLQTSAGTVVSRRMAVGESDSWVIDYK